MYDAAPRQQHGAMRHTPPRGPAGVRRSDAHANAAWATPRPDEGYCRKSTAARRCGTRSSPSAHRLRTMPVPGSIKRSGEGRWIRMRQHAQPARPHDAAGQHGLQQLLGELGIPRAQRHRQAKACAGTSSVWNVAAWQHLMMFPPGHTRCCGAEPCGLQQQQHAARCPPPLGPQLAQHAEADVSPPANGLGLLCSRPRCRHGCNAGYPQGRVRAAAAVWGGLTPRQPNAAAAAPMQAAATVTSQVTRGTGSLARRAADTAGKQGQREGGDSSMFDRNKN